MDRDYVQHYRELYERHWWWRARERVLVAELESLGVGGLEILDVGCGDGLSFAALSAFGTVRGVEPNAEAVSDARRGRVHLGAFDAAFEPQARPDLVTMLDVLEHLDDPAAALGRAHEILTDCGRLLVTVPALPMLWTSHDDLNEHRTRYTRRRLVELIEAVGFEVTRSRYLFQWTVPAKLLQRAKERLLGARPAVPAVPPAFANRLLLIWTLAEASVARRLPLPAGSSLLAVGRKR